MKEIVFRPLRRVKKTGKVAVASYAQWNKVRTANYNKFNLTVVNEYADMPKDEYVYDHSGELLYHFNYSPWDVFTYHGSCLDPTFDWDELRGKHKSFCIQSPGDDYVSYHWRGADCAGTPVFSHLTADGIGNAEYRDVNDFEPLTVGYVLDWLGWFLYQLENSNLKVNNPLQH